MGEPEVSHGVRQGVRHIIVSSHLCSKLDQWARTGAEPRLLPLPMCLGSSHGTESCLG